MKALLLVPWYKLAGYRTFWVMFATLLVLLFLITFTILKVAHLDLVDATVPLQGFFSYPYVWQNLAWLVKGGNYFFCLLIVLVICSDLDNRTLRQHVIDGFDRLQVLASYWIMCVAFALFSVVLTLLLGLMFGEKSGNEPMFQPTNLQMLGTYFLQSFAMFDFAVMLALLIARPVPTVMVLIMWHVVIEPLAGWVLDQKVYRGISELLPFHVIGQLLPDPYVVNLLAAKTSVHINVILVSLAYIAGFGVVSWLRLRLSDL